MDESFFSISFVSIVSSLGFCCSNKFVDSRKIDPMEVLGTEVVVDTGMVVVGVGKQQHMGNMACEPYELAIEGEHFP